jgi:hypothetical protein
MSSIRNLRTRYAVVTTHGREGSNEYNILRGTSEGKRQLGKTRLRWEVDMKIDLREIRWSDMD